LSIPYDISMAPASTSKLNPPTKIASRFSAEPAILEEIAEELLTAKNPLIIAGDGIGDAHAHLELQKLAALVGAGVVAEGMPTRQNIDNSHSNFFGTLPMNPKQIRDIYRGHDVILFAGVVSQAPVALFDNGGS